MLGLWPWPGVTSDLLCACVATWLHSDVWPLPSAALANTDTSPDVCIRVSYTRHNRRWIIDSRDEFTAERLAQLDDAYKLYRCKVSGVLPS